MIHDVVIAGAGPVGLFLACELRLAGISVLVLEQAENPVSPLKQLPLGLRGLSAPSIEAFYRRGLLHELTSQPQPSTGGPATSPAGAHWMQQTRQPGGHFAGIQFYLDRIDASKWVYRLPGPAGTSLALDMQQIESTLSKRATASGATIRRGLGIQSFTQSSQGVTVRAGTEEHDARWLIGCDGGRSRVRKLAGIDFAGTDPEFTGYSILADLAEPNLLKPGRHYTPHGVYTFQAPGTIALVDFDAGRFHRTQPISLEHVQAVLRRVSGTEVVLTDLKLATTWTDRAYLADTYRNGRVLLAGDAAHTHSPLGGQGLNLGLGDAMNLGWKLGAVIRGRAPAELLETYEGERRPVAERVLDWSRAQVALMRPSRSSRALESIVRDLIDTGDGATYFAERVWGVSLRYELGDPHPIVGRSAPDIELDDGRRLGELLVNGTGLLIDFCDDAALRSRASRWRDRVAWVSTKAKDSLGLRALLVRPDGIVAWAGANAPDVGGLGNAMEQWFGPSSSS